MVGGPLGPVPQGRSSAKKSSGEPAGSTKESKEALENALSVPWRPRLACLARQPLRETTAALRAKIASAQRCPNPRAMPFFTNGHFECPRGARKLWWFSEKRVFSFSRRRLAEHPGRDFVARLPPWVFCLQKQLLRTEAGLPFFVDFSHDSSQGNSFPTQRRIPHRKNFGRSSPPPVFASPGDSFWIGVTAVCRSTFLSDFFKTSKLVVQFSHEEEHILRRARRLQSTITVVLPKFTVPLFASPEDTSWTNVTSVCRSTFLSYFPRARSLSSSSRRTCGETSFAESSSS